MAFTVANDYPDNSKILLPLINSSFSEFGPFSFSGNVGGDINNIWYYFYANDEKAQFDIKFTYANTNDLGTFGDNNELKDL